MSGDETASTVSLKMGSQVKFDGVLPYETMQFSRAHLAIGEALDMPMGLGFSVAMNLPYVNIDNWYQAISSLLHDLTDDDSGIPSDQDKKPFIGEPQRIFLNAQSATVASQQLTGLEAEILIPLASQSLYKETFALTCLALTLICQLSPVFLVTASKPVSC